MDWASRYLRTTADKDQLDALSSSWSLYDLGQEEPSRRLHSLIDTAIFPNRLTASPGQVHAANDMVVEHTASVIPGISGGAGKICSLEIICAAEPLSLCTHVF